MAMPKALHDAPVSLARDTDGVLGRGQYAPSDLLAGFALAVDEVFSAR